MSTIFSLLPAGPAAGLAVAGLNLLVALALVVVSLLLCVAISLMIGLPAVATLPHRAIRTRNPGRPE
jgi:hypothetical protein